MRASGRAAAAIATVLLSTGAARAEGEWRPVVARDGVRVEERGADALTREELRTVVLEAGTFIPKRHQKMLLNLLDLEKATVEDIMIPRSEVDGLDFDEPLDDILTFLRRTHYTRIPVWEGSIDNVIGILHVREFMQAQMDEAEIPKEILRGLLREPYFVPEGTRLTTTATRAAIALPSTLNPIADLGLPTQSKRLVFSSAMGMGGMSGGMMCFLIDGKSFDPARIDLTSRLNEIEQWTIENSSSMDHPFHLHGTQFQVVSRTRDGTTTAEPFVAWRDTVNVAAFETVTLKVVQKQPGKRMYHCHILEHESQGMMGVLEVIP